jgi:glutathione S-transferase
MLESQLAAGYGWPEPQEGRTRMLTLYYSPGACSLAPHIVLEELGEPFAAKRTVIAEGQNRTPDYLKLNPTGQVPTLVVDDDKVLTQNVAILTFLGQRKPEKKLLPSDPIAAAQAISFMAFLTSTVHPTYGRFFRPSRATPDEKAHDSVKATAKEAIKGYYDDLEKKLAGQDWAVGNGYTVCDAYLHVFYRWGGRIELPMKDYKALTAHAERMRARPATGRALADEGIS